MLNTIILCIDLGIPLKDLKNYVNADGELEFEHLLKDSKKYEKNLSQLFSLAKKQDLQASFPHGIIFSYNDGQFTGSKMFLEVLLVDSSIVHKLSAGNYLCFQELREIHSDPLVIFSQKLLSHGNTNVVISSMSPNTYKYDKTLAEGAENLWFKSCITLSASIQIYLSSVFFT